MARKVIGIICYCISGFFLYSVSLISFFNDPPHLLPIGIKLLIIGIFLIPALIFLGIGLILRRLQKWKHDIAVVLLSVSALSIFTIFTVLCLFLSPEFRKFFPDNKLFYFNDYFTGVLCLLIFICVGSLLLVNSQSKRTI